MIRLNLLPDIKREYLKARRAQAQVIGWAILLSMIAIGLTVALALWVYVAQNLHKTLLTNSINDKQAELIKITDIDKYVTIQNQLANLSSLHDGKNDFSRLFSILPILNPKAPNNVSLTSVDVDDETHTIIFQGEAADFSGLVTFRDIMENAQAEYRVTSEANETTKEPLFSELTILEQTMSKTSDGLRVVGFKISAVYNQAAFLHSSRDVNVTIPKLETTPSKQDSPNLFAESTAAEGAKPDGAE